MVKYTHPFLAPNYFQHPEIKTKSLKNSRNFFASPHGSHDQPYLNLSLISYYNSKGGRYIIGYVASYSQAMSCIPTYFGIFPHIQWITLSYYVFPFLQNYKIELMFKTIWPVDTLELLVGSWHWAQIQASITHYISIWLGVNMKGITREYKTSMSWNSNESS